MFVCYLPHTCYVHHELLEHQQDLCYTQHKQECSSPPKQGRRRGGREDLYVASFMPSCPPPAAVGEGRAEGEQKRGQGE
eukprot:273439-Hanusia_phi.AAC.1